MIWLDLLFLNYTYVGKEKKETKEITRWKEKESHVGPRASCREIFGIFVS